MDTKTFRGLSLAEVEAKVRAELGDDAVVVRQREGLTGGVGGFFQRRIFEVEAVAGNGASVAPTPEAEAEAAPAAAPAPMPAPFAETEPQDFMSSLRAALGPELEQAATEQRAAHAAADFVPDALAAAARVEEAVAAPAPAPAAAPEPAPANSASALAALFAPDA